jgi:integrase
MNFLQRPNRTGEKVYFSYDFGRGPGQRPSTGIFIYATPKNQLEKNHNREAKALLEVKKSELTLERQALGSGFIPAHKYKANFLEYYRDYVNLNKRKGNRHLQNSYDHFLRFVRQDFISPLDVTENLCVRFRQYLLDRFTGDTPANYYASLKRVLKAATKEGYYRTNPTEDVKAKTNPSIRFKENLEAEEYIQLLKTPCVNREVQESFILCCYTGLRHVDVKHLEWEDIRGNLLTTRVIQRKTGKPVIITIHPIAKAILEKRKRQLPSGGSTGNVFALPSHDGCNKILQQWMKSAGIQKHITWHCARLSFSILLQDKQVDTATVALLLGQSSTKFVNETYKRHRPKDQMSSISHLPTPESIPYFLKLE